jgi:hypothetical protein
MSEKPDMDNSVIAKARRRTLWRSVGRACRVLFALVFFAALGGFAWGAWEEVGRVPERYASLTPGPGAAVLDRWSVRAARLMVSMRKDREAPPHEGRRIAGRTAPRHSPDTTSRPEPPARVEPEPPPSNPPIKPPEPDGPEYNDRESVPEPPEFKMPDKPRYPARPPTFHQKRLDRQDKEPRHASQPTYKPEPGIDEKTQAMLDKAHKVFQTAWKYHKKAAPTAPAAGRNAARRTSIKYFERARDLYQAVLKRKLPKDLHKRISDRIVFIQGRIYWAYKHSVVR